MMDLAYSNMATLIKLKIGKLSYFHTLDYFISYNTVLYLKQPKVKNLDKKFKRKRYVDDESMPKMN